MGGKKKKQIKQNENEHFKHKVYIDDQDKIYIDELITYEDMCQLISEVIEDDDKDNEELERILPYADLCKLVTEFEKDIDKESDQILRCNETL